MFLLQCSYYAQIQIAILNIYYTNAFKAFLSRLSRFLLFVAFVLSAITLYQTLHHFTFFAFSNAYNTALHYLHCFTLLCSTFRVSQKHHSSITARDTTYTTMSIPNKSHLTNHLASFGNDKKQII